MSTFRADQILPLVIAQKKAMAKKMGRSFRLPRTPVPRDVAPLQRQYLRDLNRIVAALKISTNETIVANLENIVYEGNLFRPKSDSVNEKQDDVVDSIRRAMSTGRLKFLQQFSEKEIENIVKKNADAINSFNAKDFDRIFGKVLNIPLIRSEAYLQTVTKGFITNNVSLITTIAEEHFNRVEQTVMAAVQKGTLTRDLKEQIQTKYGVTESRAALIARDQTAKFNGNLTQLRQTEVGVTKYEWSTSGDERVRPTHAANEGKIFSWDDPPAETGHPGEDYQCRCVAIPVFEGFE